MNKEIEKITKACVIANPSIRERMWKTWNTETMTFELDLYQITLADVLLAVEFKKPTMKITDTETLNFGNTVDITEETKTEIMLSWNLKKDLKGQEEETVLSIANLL